MGIFKKTAAQKQKKAIKKEVKKAVKAAPTKAAKKEIKKAGKEDIKNVKKIIKTEKKAATKKVVSKVGGSIKKTGSKLEAGLKKAVGNVKDVAFAPLLPFKKVMTDALQKRGISFKGELSDIAPKFLNNIVRNSFETTYEQNYYDSGTLISADHIDAKGVAKSAAASGSGLIGIAGKAATGDVAGAASGLIAEILNYIRKLKDKKDKAKAQAEAGQPVTDPLSPAEQAIIEQSEEVGAKLQEQVQEEIEGSIALSVKDFLFSWKGGVALGVLVLLIVVAVKKFK